MAVFTEWLGSRALTPVEASWFYPTSEQTDAVTSYFAAYSTSSVAGSGAVTLTRTRVDFFGNIVAATAPAATFVPSPVLAYSADQVSSNDVSLFFATKSAGGASGTSDIDVQRYDAAGMPAGGVTTLVSGIAGLQQLRVGFAATSGTKYFLAYSTFDAASSGETIHLAAYAADNTPLPADSRVLDSFTTNNGTTDPFGFGTLLDSGTTNPSYVELVGYEQNGSHGVLVQPVSTDGVKTGTPLFLDPIYPLAATNKNVGAWTWTRLVPNAPGTSSTNDLALAMPYSYTDAAGTHYGIDVRIDDTVHGGSLDDTIALSQNADASVSLAALPNGGVVLAYDDSGTEYLRNYGAEGFVVGSSSYALPAGTGNVKLSSLGDGRVMLAYLQGSAGSEQLDYAIYDTRQSGVTIDHTAETAPSSIAGTVNNDIIDIGGAAGPDTILGGGGTDIVVTSKAAGTGTVLVDLKDGFVSRGQQLDARMEGISGATLGAQPSVVLGLTAGNDDVFGSSGDLAFYNEGGSDYIVGGSGANAIVGGSGNTAFFGDGGHDTMSGGSNQSFMHAGQTAASQDIFYGKGGSDWVYGGPGTTLLFGGGGTENLTAGEGYNELDGSTTSASALNILNGGTGTDVFKGGVGTNLLDEGTNTDTFVGSSGTDYVYGGSGRSFVYGGSGTDVVTTGAGNQYVKAGTGQTVFNDAAVNLTAGRFDEIDNFSGGRSTDVYLPQSVAAQTRFVTQNGGTAILTATGGGTAEVFAAGTAASVVQAHTHFTL